MLKKDFVRFVKWGITVEIVANVHTIYLKGQDFEEARRILVMDDKIPNRIIDETLIILELAKECNASLQEIRSIPAKGTLKFSFEFEFWEEFLKFKKKTEELSQS